MTDGVVDAAPPAFRPAAVRVLIFDLDGTLIDSYRAICISLNAARATVGLDPLPEAKVRAAVGHGLESLVAELVGPRHVEPGVREFRRRYAEVFREQTRALPGVVETVRELHARGFRMAVASNKPARFGEPILEQLGLLDCFDAVQGPDRAGATKPDPTMLRLCLRALGATAEQAVYVGDMVLDVQTAARASVPVLLVPGGSSTAADLRRSGATLLDAFADLLHLLPRRRLPARARGPAAPRPGGSAEGRRVNEGHR